MTGRFTGFWSGFLVGALAAAVAALLLAPQPGERTRVALQHELDEVLAEGKRAAEQRRRELEARLKALRGE